MTGDNATVKLSYSPSMATYISSAESMSRGGGSLSAKTDAFLLNLRILDDEVNKGSTVSAVKGDDVSVKDPSILRNSVVNNFVKYRYHEVCFVELF